MTGLNVTDTQVKIIMFENGEVSFVGIGADVYKEALKPDNPLNPFLLTTPIASLWYVKMKTDLAPVEDVFVRRALAHAVDLKSINTALFGTASTAWATGLISPNIACHNDSPDAGLGYDPDYARQSLAESTYGSADNLPTLIFDMHYPPMINIVVAMKEYWKDNLGVELDLLKRESGMPRREGAQFYRISTASYAPDPLQIMSDLTRTDSIEALTPRPGGYPVINALVKTARSLPADHPDRCAAFQAAEQEYLDQVYMIPLRFDLVQTWAVQPWVKGFSSNINQDWHSVPWMYVLEH
jgi:oligopeptide transport system substrate-binding protein